MHKDLQTVSAVLFLNPDGIDLSTIVRLTSLYKKNIKNITSLADKKIVLFFSYSYYLLKGDQYE